MHYQTFTDQEQSSYRFAVLVPKLARDPIEREYIDPGCLKAEEVIAYTLHQTGKKTSASVMREYLDDLLPVLEDLGSEYFLVGDGEYFKALTGVNKSDAYLGYVLPNTYPKNKQGQFNVVYLPNYRQVFYDPNRVRAKIQQGLVALQDHMFGHYQDPGNDIIHFSAYPRSVTDIALWLQKLLDKDCDLTCDIEGFSLRHYDAGIGTISFAWSKHEGIAFPVDLGENPPAVRKLLLKFFLDFKRKLIFHKINFDVTVLIYQLFMSGLTDQEGLLKGLDVFLRNWDDTLLITYLATNSCAGNKLGLKEQSQEFTGNYAVEEIKDITKIPLPELLEYNLVDCLATWYVREKHWDQMVADQQLEIYEELFKPSMVDIIQMQLTGMPLNMDRVHYAKAELAKHLNDATQRIQNHTLVQELTHELNLEHVEKRNTELKKKQIKYGDEPQTFNPNSTPQKQRLLFELAGLPIIERTKTKQPATGAEVLEKLVAQTEDESTRDLLRAFLDFAEVDKIYGTFIPAMEAAQLGEDGCYYLFGNFNLGGTKSGRLSSSEPNLQTIPSTGNKYAKLIKDCFMPPEGHLMIGMDFASLEDRISALTTKDPNKLKVYTDGYDGHCLRAHSYFGDQMSDNIDPEDPESINAIKDLHPDLRQASKTPTFLLTYGGTWIGMVAKCGFTTQQAKEIEERYHNLYLVSDEWVAERIAEASQVGYVTVAFGLRLRTPLLHQTVRGTSATPYEAEAEARTAGNALGQSYCLLNNRASVEFMRRVRNSPYRNKIRIIAHIHDAMYFIIPDDIEILLFVNKYLIEAAEWQDDPAIAHDTVKLGGELSVFHPSWASEIVIPNGATEDDVHAAIAKFFEKQRQKETA